MIRVRKKKNFPDSKMPKTCKVISDDREDKDEGDNNKDDKDKDDRDKGNKYRGNKVENDKTTSHLTRRLGGHHLDRLVGGQQSVAHLRFQFVQ